MQIGSSIHNFRITNVRSLPEMNCSLWELEHEKTGTLLVWLDRADENKTFAITFKTIPEDSTGVFHILEHSVLCGSNKYPVKEPFVELLKSSVNTFLNAMTYPDKTVYPLSSRNNKDFLNLLDSAGPLTQPQEIPIKRSFSFSSYMFCQLLLHSG